MTANPIPEAMVDALYDELFRVGRYLHAPVPIDPKEIIRRHLTAAQQQPAGDGCHCGTCTCNPNMTPAVRFDLSPAQQEGAIREHLIRLGWTPPDEHAVSQPAAPSGAVNVVGMPEFDGLLDHIYEYGTAAEGVVERANAFARAVIARYAPQQPAAVDEAAAQRLAEAVKSEPGWSCLNPQARVEKARRYLALAAYRQEVPRG